MERAALTPEAARQIVALIPALRAFGRTFCRHPADIEDLVQETLAKGVAGIHQFQPGTSMRSWLFTIMRHTFCTRIRVYAREAPGEAACVSSRPVTAAGQEWSIRGQEIVRAVQRLPCEQREMLILTSVLGISYEDAAEICGCPVGTVKSRLNRARRHLVVMSGEAAVGGMLQRDAR